MLAVKSKEMGMITVKVTRTGRKRFFNAQSQPISEMQALQTMIAAPRRVRRLKSLPTSDRKGRKTPTSKKKE